MSDFPLAPSDPALRTRLVQAMDAEGKLLRALDILGPIAGRDVVLLDGGRGLRARQLAELGGKVTVLERDAAYDDLTAAFAEPVPGIELARGEPASTGLPSASADVVVALWSAFLGPDPAEVAEAARVLRPGGRLIVVHDYGRDDVSRLRGPNHPEYASWSRRDGPFLQGGFKLRVIHCWWTFDSLEDAASLLRDGFGAAAEPLLAALARPRLSHNVAVYHRTMGGAAPAVGAPTRGAAQASGPAPTPTPDGSRPQPKAAAPPSVPSDPAPEPTPA